MRIKKKSKIFLLLMTAVLLLSGNSFLTKAADEGKCVHGGKDFDVKTHAYLTYKYLLQKDMPGVEHPCYVQGKLVSCKTYFDKYMEYYACNECDEIIVSGFGFSPLRHEYRHN